MGEPEERISRGDRRFVVRLVIAGVIALLLGVWGLLVLDETGFGDCAARGFKTVTDTPNED